MSGKWKMRLAWCALQCMVLTGLCAPAGANTTAAPGTAPATVPEATPALVRIAVLLPLRSATLGSAADAVRAGVYAGFQREPQGVTLQLIETDGGLAELKEAYARASADADIIIGPLSRTEVGHIAQHARVDKPTVALASPDLEGAPAGPPARLLMMGLSIEDEARQAANWINGSAPEGDAIVVATATSWQQRAAKAFSAEWQALGRSVQTIELGWSEGFLNSVQVAQLKKRLRPDTLLFVALDAQQAGQLRNSVGRDVTMVGTSQLNALARRAEDLTMNASLDTPPGDKDSAANLTRASLDGVRLVDIPWQLQPDHAAVMVYPPLPATPGEPPNADSARLYALGIDAYRVAHALSQQGERYEVDGVTGKLQVRFDAGAARFERVLQGAVMRDGLAQPLRESR